MKTFEITTRSAEETIALGEKLGKLLTGGVVLTLFGDLAAGKTTFTRGLAAGLGITDGISSPTFTLIHEHEGRLRLCHADLYRLSCPEEIDTIGLEEYINDDCVTVTEWSERFEDELPENRIDIEITRTGENERKFVFRSEVFGNVVEELENAACP
ncbi:MAG: tRNA (adenosine(37)-N6)-threonylcarbamoyltransferase complex ATPase subunit type 1 TsaE [Abditibacteriota bacterium]|nr:tRNA (adenosine(37)-N6)-threonylcarbamoyltransferase complex ATPase subunit type 1 TsaE [Abditibacteriota bacterium]